MPTRQEDLVVRALSNHMENTAKAIILGTERGWKANSRVRTGRARASVIASVGEPSAVNTDVTSELPVEFVGLLAENGRREVNSYKLRQGDLYVTSTISYAVVAYNDFTAVMNGILTGLRDGSLIRGRFR